jgi:hypothetical protein
MGGVKKTKKQHFLSALSAELLFVGTQRLHKQAGPANIQKKICSNLNSLNTFTKKTSARNVKLVLIR